MTVLLKSKQYISLIHPAPYIALCDSLSEKEKKCLLPRLADARSSQLTALFIGNNVDLYKELLKNSKLRHLHLEPLAGDPTDSNWQSKAILAMEEGFPSDRIVLAVLGSGWTTWGNLSQLWADWADKFSRLREHSDPRINELGVIGVAFFEERKAEAELRENSESIGGLCEDD